MDIQSSKIFVQIASYRDPELTPTLADMFAKAADPERVFVGICLQVAAEDMPECGVHIPTFSQQIRVTQCTPNESKGAGWARNQAQALWQGEEYTLQIHAHMRFEQNWDVELIEMLARCPSEKPVLTGWLPHYEPPNNKNLHKGFVPRLKIQKVDIHDDPQIVHFGFGKLPHAEATLAPSPGWVGNFMFAQSPLFKQFAYDAHIYFWGEELAYSLRLWTHGYDFFQYDKVMMQHQWYRPAPKDQDIYRDYMDERNIQTRKRLQHLLGIQESADKEAIKDLDKYVLGNTRCLAEYQQFSGINFNDGKVASYALNGKWKLLANTPSIFVAIAAHRDAEITSTIVDMFAKAAHPEHIRVGVCLQTDPGHPDEKIDFSRITHPNNVRVKEVDAKDSKGANWARAEAMSLRENEAYTLMVDAHMRFKKNWDASLIESMESLPEKSVLTYYCPHYALPDKRSDKSTHLRRIHVERIGDENDPQLVHLISHYIAEDSPQQGIYPTPFVVAHFLFAKSSAFEEVPIDPHITFWGDEVSLSARLWTHGYNAFQLPNAVAFHHWRNRDIGIQASYTSPKTDGHLKSYERVMHLLKLKDSTRQDALHDMAKYGLGKERDLKGLWQFAGVNIEERKLSPAAKNGSWNRGASEVDMNTKVTKTSGKKSPTIFVAIAAYRDPECEHTVADLFAQATYPNRVSVGICWQGSKEEQCFSKSPTRPTQVRVKEVNYQDSLGANWARAEALQLKRNEDYVLVIDSHMRFEKGWDETLLKSITECEAKKPVLTYFSPSYDPPRKLVTKDQRRRRVRVNYLGKPNDPQLVHLTRALIDDKDERTGLYPSPFVVFHCIFAPASTFDEVPIDPNIHFWGDEITYSARLWTHGYDVFQLDNVLAYHQWFNRDEAVTEAYKKTSKPENQKALKRIKHVLAVELTEDEPALRELDKYGHGEERSIEAFWEFSGIDPWARKVSKAAHDGFWGKPLQFEATAAEEGMDINPENARIFVQIASYRDPECQRTVKDLFEKATYPDRVFVGICWQYIAEEDKDCFEIITRPEQVRVLHYDAKDSLGACWARAEAQKLYQGEEYTLQLDAHMRFEPGWDETLISMLKNCDSPKAVISSYPPSFTPPDKINKGTVFGIVAKEFNDRGILTMKGKGTSVKNLPTKPQKGAFVGAGFLFGPGSIIRDVPYDPKLYFFGEEVTLAVRLWTHGYDIYYPNAELAYHDWERKKRKRTHFNDHKNWEELNRKSYQRVRHMLKMETSEKPAVLKDLDKFGLGTARTLEQYQQYAGVDFARRMISDSAFRGEFPAKHMGVVPRIEVTPEAKEPPRQISNMHGGLIKSYESAEAIVFDNFLPEDLYERIYNQSVQGDYKHINTTGKVSRVWNIDNGFPLRSVQDYFYYAKGAPKPKAETHYPTGKIHDQFMDHIVNINPQVSHIVGEQNKNWGHFTATTWIYPPNTGLSLHNDGSGVYSGAYVYFLNPTWRLHWGGLLMVMDGEANKSIKQHKQDSNGMAFYRKKWLHESEHNELVMEAGFARTIFPKRNRIVFIAPDAYHMVTKVAPTAGDNVRMSIAGFFNLNKANAEGKSG